MDRTSPRRNEIAAFPGVPHRVGCLLSLRERVGVAVGIGLSLVESGFGFTSGGEGPLGFPHPGRLLEGEGTCGAGASPAAYLLGKGAG